MPTIGETFLAAGGSSEELLEPLFGLMTLVLAGVVVVALVLLRFKQSLLVGYFLCGVILANSGVLSAVGGDWDWEQEIDTIAQFGIILLMFTLGVEFSVAEIRHLRRVALVGGGWQVGLVTLIAGGCAMAFGAPWAAALAIGVAVALSSTAVSLKAFQDLGMPESPGARVALGIAIFQDVFVIFFMIILAPLLGTGERSMATGLGLAIVKGAVFLAIAWFLSRRGIPNSSTWWRAPAAGSFFHSLRCRPSGSSDQALWCRKIIPRSGDPCA